VSFWVGVAAVLVASLLAAVLIAALGGLLILSKVSFDGVWAVFLFGIVWPVLFFLSYPLQRRSARALDSRRPGISLKQGILAAHVTKDSVLHFNLNEPHELVFGWWEHVLKSPHYKGNRARSVWMHATLSQSGRQLHFVAEDAIPEAQSSGWPKTPDSSTPATPRVSLWVSDLMALVETIRTHPARRGASF